MVLRLENWERNEGMPGILRGQGLSEYIAMNRIICKSEHFIYVIQWV